MVRVIDAKQVKENQAKQKLDYKAEFVDTEARNLFQASKVTTSMVKCANGCDHYGLRHSMINNNLIESNCPRCNQVETWDHVIRCNETIEIRKDFIKELLKDLLKEINDQISVDNMFSFGEDAMRYLEYEDNEDECETSQSLIGMKDLFRGHIVKMWFGIDICSNICRSANKVVVRKCVKFYAKCQKHQNEAYYDKEKQKIRIKNWLRKEKEMAMQSENAQVREYANVFKTMKIEVTLKK